VWCVVEWFSLAERHAKVWRHEKEATACT
jgi:hypothetical protein